MPARRKAPANAPPDPDRIWRQSLVLREIADFHPMEVELADLFACLTRVEAEEDWNVLACLNNFTDQEEADRLNESALQMVTALADVLAALARPHWGDPAYRYPGRQPPEWMELYLYPNGVPNSLEYLIGWKRQSKCRRPMVVLAFITEEAGPEPDLWQLALVLGVHELDEEESPSSRRSRTRPTPSTARPRKVKQGRRRSK